MRVRVLFFGQLKDIVGRSEEFAEVDEGARVEDLFARYGARHPMLAKFRSSVAASVNRELAEWESPLAQDDEVAFLPPVSGGSDRGVRPGVDVCEIVREPIRTAELAAHLKAPGDGAVTLFEGIVRDNSKGRRTLYLDYEGYEPMALTTMAELIAEIRGKFPIDRVALVHRLGRLQIGETSVFVGISSAHRGAAFDACRYGIDTLKKTVPIWKKEYFEDGTVWADGEILAVPSNSADSESKT